MTIQALITLIPILYFQVLPVSYSLGVHNGSHAEVDDVEVISEEIKFSRELGVLPVGIDKSVGLLGTAPKQVVVKWRRGDDRLSRVVSIPEDVRQRVGRRSRLYVRILDDGKAAAYVEIINPLDLTKRSYYPPEYAPKPGADK